MENPKFVIEKVEIKDLFRKYNLDWELHDDVNILAGINGIGKSTILEGIIDAQPFGAFKKVKNINNIKVTTNFSKENRDSKLIANVTEDENGIEVKTNFYFLEHIKTFDIQLRSKSDLAAIRDKRVTTNLDLYLNRLQIFYLNYKLDVSNKYENLNIHNFYNLINQAFSYSHKIVNENVNELSFLNENKEPVNVYQLSSGEKQLLIILLSTLLQYQQPSILLLDEPELSLHIDWQRNLINYIRTLNPHCQIIIASHSPGIAMNGWLDKVFEVRDLIRKTQNVITA